MLGRLPVRSSAARPCARTAGRDPPARTPPSPPSAVTFSALITERGPFATGRPIHGMRCTAIHEAGAGEHRDGDGTESPAPQPGSGRPKAEALQRAVPGPSRRFRRLRRFRPWRAALLREGAGRRWKSRADAARATSASAREKQALRSGDGPQHGAPRAPGARSAHCEPERWDRGSGGVMLLTAAGIARSGKREAAKAKPKPEAERRAT